MRRLDVLAGPSLAGSGLRYGIAGATVAAVYLGVPVVLNGGAGVPIQVVIAIAYLLAISLHFTLQRHFVFRQVTAFALTRRAQIAATSRSVPSSTHRPQSPRRCCRGCSDCLRGRPLCCGA